VRTRLQYAGSQGLNDLEVQSKGKETSPHASQN
jgi:hypothetical protein